MNNDHSNIIKKFCLNPNDSTMGKIVHLYKSDEISDKEISALAKSLADSGEQIRLGKNQICADIPSTGGPSSLSTLICPLVLEELGYYIPKLAVPGRPAGGIDVLYQLKNYKIDFTKHELIKCLNKNKYCHFLVGKNYTPLDDVLFQYRARNNAKATPALVIASILSKKIAVGLTVAGLDVRVSKFGNFGENWYQSRENSKRFIKVAKLSGIKAACFLNESNTFHQPFIGRGESLVALYKTFNDEMDDLLKSHIYKCIDMAVKLCPSNSLNIVSALMSLKKNFIKNLLAQGSNWDSFETKVKEIQNSHCHKIKANKSGIFGADLKKIRDAIVWSQSMAGNAASRFPDPCGVVFKKRQNEFAEKGEVVLTYRSDNRLKGDFKNKIIRSISISDRYCENIDYEIVR
jgi:thymidine phosphorylase